MRWILGTTAVVAIGLAGPSRLPPVPKDTLPALKPTAEPPLGLPPLQVENADSPRYAARVRLGRKLFFDPILSKDRTVACASCHRPEHGLASPDPVAVGIRGQRGTRNAPTLWNIGYGKSFFWDGRAASLEEQALQPIVNPRELGSSYEEVLGRLRTDASYKRLFQQAFGSGEIAKEHIGQAIAAFERTLVSGNSLVDRFHAADVRPLSTEARQGMWIFESRGRCWRCHSGPYFSDGEFHNTGVSWGKEPIDLGRYVVTKRDADRGAFKTPTLRNVALTAPYMHDGSIKTLEDVVRFYNKGGTKNPYLDKEMKPLNLSEREIRYLVAFLEALTGDNAAIDKRKR